MEKQKLYDFSLKVNDFDGVPGDTLQQFAKMAIAAPLPDARGPELLDRFALGMKITKCPPAGIELTEVEKDMILTSIKRSFPTPIIYKAFKDFLGD